MAIDSGGNVWVANKGNGTPGAGPAESNVMELSSSGAILKTYTTGSYPYSIAINSAGDVWVTNFGSGIVGKGPMDSNVQRFVGGAAGPRYFPYSGPMWPGAE